MSLDTTLLKFLRTRERYRKMIGAVPLAALDPKTAVIVKDFGKFYDEFDVDVLPDETFRMWFKSFAHPKLKEEQLAVYDSILRDVLTQPIDPGVEEGLMGRLVAAETAVKVAELVQKWHDGQEVDLYVELRDAVEAFEQQTNRKVKLPYVEDNIEALLEDDKNDTGFHWRLDCLNRSMRPLRPGDFGIIAARPDKGKTTFLTSELTFMASQVDELFPGQQRSIIWLNNEGPGNRIIKRTYQSALNATISELVELANTGTLRAAYMQAVGRPDALRVFDIHDFWNYEVEDIFRQFPPAVVVFDMIDNIRFGGAAANNGQRTDQLLEAQYQWARMMAVKYDCVTLATSQISAEGDGLAYPTLSMLKDSKTGKQGAAEFIVTLGASNEAGLSNSRFIGMTKNKLAREGQPKSPRCEVIFDGDRGRYVMPEAL